MPTFMQTYVCSIHRALQLSKSNDSLSQTRRFLATWQNATKQNIYRKKRKAIYKEPPILETPYANYKQDSTSAIISQLLNVFFKPRK